MIKLSQKERDALHFKYGVRETKFKYHVLNFEDAKIGEFTSLNTGNITFNSLAQIKRRATFTFKENELNDIDWLNNKVQPFFMLKIGNEWKEYPLGVFLISSPTRKEKNSFTYRDVEAYDPSLILLEDKFDTRYFIKQGTNYIEAITKILNDAGIWKVDITKHLGTLKVDKEFEIGTSKLDAVNELLKDINYTSIWVDECFRDMLF